MELSTLRANVELLDLPDEMLMMIMQKLTRNVELLSSLIGVGNARLENLALERCSFVDLTYDFLSSPWKRVIERFLSHTLPRIYNNIESLAMNLEHLSCVTRVASSTPERNFPHLKQLKIIRSRRLPYSGIPMTTECFNDSELRRKPFFSSLPAIFSCCTEIQNRLIDFLRLSPVMDNLVSFELESDWVLSVPRDNELLFPRSPHLTAVHVTLRHYSDCVQLLRQIGSQLVSLTLHIIYIHDREGGVVWQLASLRCPLLRKLSLIVYRNIFFYEQCVLPLLQRLSSVEHLQLLLAIGYSAHDTNRFIDGNHLQQEITSYMPHLRQFDFHIRSVRRDGAHVEPETIQKSFSEFQQPVVSSVDYFSNGHSQSHVYSIPFVDTRLDFISNRFPLFDTRKTFSHVTTLILYDDVQPFEHVFFDRLAQTLPHLRTLEILNALEQTQSTPRLVEFPRLMTLLLHDIHIDYADEMLSRCRLPCLIELVIRNEPLLALISRDQGQTRDNCSHVRILRTPPTDIQTISALRTFFPLPTFSTREE